MVKKRQVGKVNLNRRAVILFGSALILGMLLTVLVFVSPASAGSSRVVTGTVEVAAEGFLEILAAEAGEVLAGHITTTGSADHYDIMTRVDGEHAHLTGGPTHIPRTKDQNATFVGENLEFHNVGQESVTISFAVVFSSKNIE